MAAEPFSTLTPPAQAPPALERAASRSLPWAPLLLLTAAALALRLLRLPWQPLWWDEGYSLYFATEPLRRMVALTAQDIHPPLYYALLRAWMRLVGATTPEAARMLSALLGAAAVPAIAWVAHQLFPGRRALLWIAAVGLAISPMHLFYSQEVRMYGLALLLLLLATGHLWRVVTALQRAEQPVPWGAVAWYVVLATLALYTLYYGALLLGAHAIWAVVVLRRRIWPALVVAWAAIALLYVPWLLYAAPRLVGYVAQKVTSDQDRPLGLIEYLARHGRAFLGGHVTPAPVWEPFFTILIWVAAAAAVALMGAAWLRRRSHIDGPPEPVDALLTFVALPLAAAFALNLRLPFFPTGGERLLLMLLPFLLLLVAAGAAWLWGRSRAPAGIALILLALPSVAGVGAFFTTPRYVEDDFRPLLRQVVQQGAQGDSLVAIFPWMVGYWRAYAPPTLEGAQPLLLGDGAVVYGSEVESVLADALQKGTLWFPEPLAFGSDLPLQMEEWLAENARAVDNRWYSESTRLTAWSAHPAVPLAMVASSAVFGPLRLESAGAAQSATAGGAPLPVTLVWRPAAPVGDDLAISLRLLDESGQIWATHDFAAADLSQSGAPFTSTVALLVPPGTPPGDYLLTTGVGRIDADGETRLLPLQGSEETLLAPVGQVAVLLPETPPHEARFGGDALRPVAGQPLRTTHVQLPADTIVAGDQFGAELVVLSQVESPPLVDLEIRLTARSGDASASWRGWPLPQSTTASWPQGYPVRVPVSFYLPADLPAGAYNVTAAWAPPDGEAGTPVNLGQVNVVQRPRIYTRPTGGVDLEPVPTLGTHSRLQAYSLQRDGNTITLGLTWEALQPLLPPHHIFVHADVDDDGAPGGLRTVAQDDGPPRTVDGAAPTGTWLAGESITTQHTLTLPADSGPLTLRVGLYNPQSLVRLPVTINGAVQGDAIDVATISPASAPAP